MYHPQEHPCQSQEHPILDAVRAAESALQRARTSAELRRLGVGVGTLAERREEAKRARAVAQYSAAATATAARELLQRHPPIPKLAFRIRLALGHHDLFNEFLLSEGLAL